jgi:uncharacterized protein (TIGR03437 family)
MALASPAVTYTISTIAGGTECGDGGAAALAQLGSPEGLAVDQAGNLYIADAVDHRVRRVSSAGIITTVAGNGYPGFRGDGGPAREAQLNAPYGLAVDAAGSLYIADLGNDRIRKVSSDGVIQTIAGGGVAGLTLSQPRNLALDAAGNLYISDFGGHRVFRLSPAGFVSPVAGTGSVGSIDDGASVQASLAPLRSPAGLAVDVSGAVYIADSGNHKVRKVLNGWMTTVPVPSGLLYTPTGLALDAAGGLYVAAKGSSLVLKLAPVLARVAGNGYPGYSGDGGPAVLANLTGPRDIVFDAAGNLYVADARAGLKYSIGVVRRVSVLGMISTFAAGATFRAPGDGGPPTSAHLDAPSALALDAASNLYVADRDDHRVRRVSASVIVTLAGIGFPGSGGDGGFAICAQLDQPEGIALHPSGDIWISESAGNRLRRITALGFIDTISADLLRSPSGIAIDAAGVGYVADTLNRVVRKVGAGGSFSVLDVSLDQPTGVSLDSAGNLYIADSGAPAILKVTPSGVLSTVAASGAGTPTRVALDAENNLYIADTSHHRVLKLTPVGVIATIAGTGSPGYSGDGGPALSAELDEPADVAVDSSGNVFIADRGNGVVRKLTPSPLPPAPVGQPATLDVASIVNAASMLPGAIAPGELVTLFGAAFQPGATQVLFDAQPAALLYVDPSQINLQAPDSITGGPTVEIEVRTPAHAVRLIVPAAEANPGLFRVAVNENGSLNSPSQPALAGSVVTLYATGEGKSLPLSLAIAGQPAVIVSARSAGGVLEIHAKIPEGCPLGEQPVVLTAGRASSQPGVTLTLH